MSLLFLTTFHVGAPVIHLALLTTRVFGTFSKISHAAVATRARSFDSSRSALAFFLTVFEILGIKLFERLHQKGKEVSPPVKPTSSSDDISSVLK